jgi:ABC-type multidrug transport system fused ATPase/permease subunit
MTAAKGATATSEDATQNQSSKPEKSANSGQLQEKDRGAAAGVLSTWTLSYCSALVGVAARKRKLEISDCWMHGKPTEEQHKIFETLWAEEKKKPDPSIMRIVWKVSKWEFIKGGVFMGIADLLKVCAPILLNQIVRFVEIYVQYGQGDSCRAQVDAMDRHLCSPTAAIALPLIFCGSVLVQSLLMIQSTQASLRLALQSRSMTVSACFRKSLRLSSIGAGSSSAGLISNLISNDTQQILQFAPMMHQAWTSPFTLMISFLMLWYAVGIAFILGVAVIFVFFPFILVCLRMMLKMRGEMVKFTDLRVKLITDVLTGIRVIKAYGWEEAIVAKVSDARKTELKWNARRGTWTAILITTVFSLPIFNAIAIFTFYAIFSDEFRASNIFMALATLNSMRFALVFGPFLLIQWANYKIALKRMTAFLLVDEVPAEVTARVCPKNFAYDLSAKAIALENGSAVPLPPVVEEYIATQVEVHGADAAWAVPDPPLKKGKGKGKGLPKCLARCFGKGKGKSKGNGESSDEGNGKGNGEAGSDGDAKGDGKDDAEAEKTGKNIVNVQKNGKDVRLTQVLFGIDFQAAPGEITAVVGQVASGKSSLLQCLLCEMEMLTGSPQVSGSIAYVAQQAFILNATLRQNITLAPSTDLPPGKEEFYQEILRACALTDDLALLPAGDLSEIGERGVNLSGGQKQRISMARAVYSQAEVVLLDDPLSAVDAHVGKHLLEQVIGEKGMLAGKTRILVTHQLQCLEACKQIYMMEEGKVAHAGDYATLVKEGHLEPQQASREEEKGRAGSKDASGDSAKNRQTVAQDYKDQEGMGQLVMEEEREEGELRWVVVKNYILSGGLCAFFIWLFGLVLQQSAEMCTQGWLAAWASGEGMGTTRDDDYPVGFYIGIYIGLGVSQNIFLLFRQLMLLVVHTRRASMVLHDRMTISVFHAKMVFFDRNPLGRIVNRFTRDMEYIDMVLVTTISQFVNCMAGIISAMCMICGIYPPFLLVAVLGGLVVFYFLKYFRNTSRELQRLESVTLSPIFALLQQSQAGVGTIRAYGISHLILRLADRSVDINTGIYYLMASATAWLQFRLDIISLTILAFVSAVPMAYPAWVDPGYVGLAIVYAMEFSNLLKFGARQGAELEQKFNSVDRTLDYIENIPFEAEWQSPKDKDLPAEWPAIGDLFFREVTMRYRPGLEPALKNISFKVNGGEKVGVCGRTGSGKSSIIVALLRLTESEGRIEVDGVNLQELGLHVVRQRISMIPQDPMLFLASLRGNVDPLGVAESDDQLLKALDLVRLGGEVQKLGGLDYMVQEGGSNFSVGQRQLLCLARAVLRRSRLVLLDEATANVDHQTDETIQATIRQEFASSTVLTIAHRLNTILDNDRILVLQDGRVGEFGKPGILARDPTSRFHGLLRSAGCDDFIAQSQQQDQRSGDQCTTKTI